MDSSPKFICVGVVVSAHGIKGEVKIRTFVEDIDLLEEFPLLNGSGKQLFTIKITGELRDAIIAKISNINDRNSAELLKGTELFIPASSLPKVQEGEFYHSQLRGLEVRLQNGEIIGKINIIDNFGAGDIVEISLLSGESEMLPFSSPWVNEINIEQGFIVVTPAEYLSADNL